MNYSASRYYSSTVLCLLGLLLGFLQALVFDFPFDAVFVFLAPLLSVLSLGGFLWVLKNLSPRQAMLFGYCFGLGLFAWGLNWVYISMDRFGGSSTLFAVLANAAIVMYLALYWLIGAYLIARLGRTPNQGLLLAAPVIVLLEWVRSVFLLGFPWLSIGYGWIDTPVSQLAAIGGVWLVSFVVILMLSVLMTSIKMIFKAVFLIGLTAILFLVPKTLEQPMLDNSVKVALLQGNMSVITAYDDARMMENVTAYSSLTDKVIASGEQPDVIVWPESSIPYFQTDIALLKRDLLSLQQKHQFDFISGLPYFDRSQRQFFNAILLQKADGSIDDSQYYFKQHLLPFGEYLPFRSIFNFFKDFVTIPMADFTAGQTGQADFVINGLVFSPSICFEAVFGNEIRQKAAQADVLLNISNDAWFGQSKAQAQHLNIVRMRAVENQKNLIRATNNGITAIIAPTGEVTQHLKPFTRDYLIANVAANRQLTFYSRYGDTPWLLLFTGMIVLVLVSCYLREPD